jgi:hypothetical protein
MASCFEVALALAEAGYVSDNELNEVTTVLVETLLATGTIKERSRAVEDKTNIEELYKAAEYTAAADEAMGNFEDEINQAEIMLEAKARQLFNEEVIITADEVIAQNAQLATTTLVEKGFVNSADRDKVVKLIAMEWSSPGQ